MNQRQHLLLGFVVAAAILVMCNGCTAMPDEWAEYPTKEPLAAIVMRLTAAEVTSICGKGTMGCVHRDYAQGFCIVYVDKRPLPETIPHELLHCSGFEH